VAEGVFSVSLGETVPLTDAQLQSPALWLDVTVEGQTLTPRQQLLATPYARRADAVANGIPAAVVMFFNLAACPAGWSEFTSARGRYVLGLPQGGTLGAPVGIPLADQEDRPAGQHTHGITDPGHVHSYVNDGIWQSYCGGNWCQDRVRCAASDRSRSADGRRGGTGITVNSFGGVAGTNAPFVQLLACQKD
jgi:hypothetical protein